MNNDTMPIEHHNLSNKNFLECLDIVLKWEGEYVNDPNDPGGETKYGISKRSFPNEDIKNLTKKRTSEIYYNDYWLKLSCDVFPKYMALCIFDGGVNSGVVQSTKFLQRALHFKESNVDGIIGKQTLNAIYNRYDDFDLINDYMKERILFLNKLSTFNRFGEGWIKRVLDIFYHSIKFYNIF